MSSITPLPYTVGNIVFQTFFTTNIIMNFINNTHDVTSFETTVKRRVIDLSTNVTFSEGFFGLNQLNVGGLLYNSGGVTLVTNRGGGMSFPYGNRTSLRVIIDLVHPTTGAFQSNYGTYTLNLPTPLSNASINASSTTVNLNASTILTASASGASGIYTYQWKRNNVNVSNATLSTYTIFNNYLSQTDLSYNYSCVISSGSETLTTSQLLITIKGYGLPVAGTPSATKSSFYFYESTTLSLPTLTGGKPTYNYQWLVDGSNNVSGATSASYTISNHTETSQVTKQYTCRVTDAAGSVTTSSAVPITFLVAATAASTTASVGSGQYANIGGKPNGVLASIIGGSTINPPIQAGSFGVSANGIIPPSGVTKTYIELKSSSVNIPGIQESVEFVLDKFDVNGAPLASVLGTASTYSTIPFTCDISKSFMVVWGGSTPPTRTAFYNASDNTITYYKADNITLQATSDYSIVMVNNGVTGGKRSFTYTGPNSSTYMLVVAVNAALPCFVAGTRILTPAGEKLVENLKTGDIILSADGRKLPVTMYSTKIAKTTKENAPYLIPTNAFRSHFPPQDITLSPKHAIQSGKGIWEIPQFAEERFPAIQKTCVGESVTYFHIELPNFFTDNVIANGSVCESLGANAQKLIPKGTSLYTFKKKLNGFVRYSPTSTSKSKSV